MFIMTSLFLVCRCIFRLFWQRYESLLIKGGLLLLVELHTWWLGKIRSRNIGAPGRN